MCPLKHYKKKNRKKQTKKTPLKAFKGTEVTRC